MKRILINTIRNIEIIENAVFQQNIFDKKNLTLLLAFCEIFYKKYYLIF